MDIKLISFVRIKDYDFKQEFDYQYWLTVDTTTKKLYTKIIQYDTRDFNWRVKYKNNASSHVKYALHPAAIDLLYHAHGYLLGREHIVSWVRQIILLTHIILPDIAFCINIQMCYILMSDNYLKWSVP